MANKDKKFLDLSGLVTYDGQIKQTINGVKELIPSFSVNSQTETLEISFPYSISEE